MWMFTDIANWWDKNRDETNLMLDSYVEQNPNQFAVVVATAVHTSVSLGGSVVDLLRLGDGVQQGGWGYAEDGLRLLGIAGPAGKSLQLLKSAKNGKVAELIFDPNSSMGICGWVASTKAIAHVNRRPGAKLYAEVKDLIADNMDLFIKGKGGLLMEDIKTILGRSGVSAGAVKKVRSFENLKMMVPRDGSVLMVGVNLFKNGKKTVSHALYLFRENNGALKIMDRTEVYDSLEAVAHKYGVDKIVPFSALEIKNILGKIIGPRGTGTLAIEVKAVVFEE